MTTAANHSSLRLIFKSSSDFLWSCASMKCFETLKSAPPPFMFSFKPSSNLAHKWGFPPLGILKNIASGASFLYPTSLLFAAHHSQPLHCNALYMCYIYKFFSKIFFFCYPTLMGLFFEFVQFHFFFL